MFQKAIYFSTALLIASVTGCTEDATQSGRVDQNNATCDTNTPHTGSDANVEGLSGMPATITIEGFQNPSKVRMINGSPYVCDAKGVWHVHVSESNPAHTHLIATGFATEFWKSADAENDLPAAYEIGSLDIAAISHPDFAYVISDSGHADGEDRLLLLPSGIISADQGQATDPFEKEGNFIGFSIQDNTLYTGGQGEDNRTAILAYDLESQEWRIVFEADQVLSSTPEEDPANSPMATHVESNILWALFSRDPRKDDHSGVMVKWDLENNELIQSWGLSDLPDPLDFAKIPGDEDRFFIVANNWSRSSVQSGSLVAVEFIEDSIQQHVVSEGLNGPTSCAYDPQSNSLFVSTLGESFDNHQGQLVRYDDILKHVNTLFSTQP